MEIQLDGDVAANGAIPTGPAGRAMAQPMKERRLERLPEGLQEGLQEYLMLERRARVVIEAMTFWVAERESRD